MRSQALSASLSLWGSWLDFPIKDRSARFCDPMLGKLIAHAVGLPFRVCILAARMARQMFLASRRLKEPISAYAVVAPVRLALLGWVKAHAALSFLSGRLRDD